MDYSYYYEMAGKLLGEGNSIIAIGVDESICEAHFHVFRNEVDFKAWKSGVCLLFKDNKYVNHGKNTEVLTRDELEAMVECLKSKPEKDISGNTYW